MDSKAFDDPERSNGLSNVKEENGTVEEKREKGPNINIEQDDADMFDYDVFENPNIILSFAFAMQHVLMSLSRSLSTSLLVADIVCARSDENYKARLLSTTMFISGLTTLLQNTIGIRLPLYQGPSASYVVPLLAMTTLPEWKCPEFSESGGLNLTSVMQSELESTIQRNTLRLEGSLMIAGAVHLLIGLLGGVGFLLRFIGPVTVVPALTITSIVVYSGTVKFAKAQWGVAFLTTAIAFILSFYLRHRQTPIPSYSRGRGFYIRWYPLHKMFSVLIACLVGWGFSAILTAAGVFSDDPASIEYFARTDSRLDVIEETDWFIFPYPGQFGRPGYDTGALITFILGTISSVIDSIGDYYACSKVCNAPPPPAHAVNRGIFVEGFMSFLGGWSGAGHATSTFGGNIGAISITRVASLRVLQCVGVIFIVFGVVGKLGAVFITIPYSVIGGMMMVNFGVLIGVMLANLQFIDMNSTRNMAIIGISMLVSLMLPDWISNTDDAIDTGNETGDSVIRMFLANPAFVSGFLACFLDNTIPGTDEERGLLAWKADLGVLETAKLQNAMTQDQRTRSKKLLECIYTIPYVDRLAKKFPKLKYIPIFPRPYGK